MRKSFNIIILSGFVLCSLLNGFAQEKVVTEEELTALKNNAYGKLKDKIYRVTMISKSYKNASDLSPNYFINEVSEYVPPDRVRRLRETKNEQGASRTEAILIGQKTYVKLKNEDWKELPPLEDKSFGGIKADVSDRQKTVEVKYKGQTTIKNQSADLYEIRVTRKYDSPTFRSITVDIERYWLNKDGMFLKRESESKRDSEKAILHIIWEYEYDPSIKIEAPIIKSAPKTPAKP